MSKVIIRALSKLLFDTLVVKIRSRKENFYLKFVY